MSTDITRLGQGRETEDVDECDLDYGLVSQAMLAIVHPRLLARRVPAHLLLARWVALSLRLMYKEPGCVCCGGEDCDAQSKQIE